MVARSGSRAGSPDREENRLWEPRLSNQSGTPSTKPVVVVIDEQTRAELFELWLTERYTVRTARNLEEIPALFDETVSVVLVRNEVSEKTKAAITDQIEARSPYCRTILTTTEHVEIMFPKISYDVCLSEPTTKEVVRKTVDRLVRRAVYQSTLEQYYRTSLQITNLEIGAKSGELEDDSDYDGLRERNERLQTRLRKLRSTFDEDDFRAVKKVLRPRIEFGEASSKQNNRRGKENEPNRCVGCGRRWDTADGNYRKLGAFVWKCTACGTVQNLPDPSHRRVTKR